jgi:hypothetical protein
MISSQCLSSLHIILFRTVLVAVLGHLTGDDNICADFFVGQACIKSQLRESKEVKGKKLKMCCTQELDAVRGSHAVQR